MAAATTTVAANGTWTADVSLVGQGAQSIVAKDTDAAGNVGISAAISFTLDTIAPTVAISSISGLTNAANQTVSGTGEAGTTVSLFLAGSATAAATTTVAADGTWSTVVALLGQGAHTIVAKDVDAAGNVGVSNSVSYTLDTIAPTMAITSIGGLTGTGTLSILGVSGAEDAGSSVSLYVDGSTVASGSATIGANGSWNANALFATPGTHSVLAKATDAAGNTGVSGVLGDIIVGGAGNDTLGGGSGTHILIGELGNDVYLVELCDGCRP